MAAHSIVGEWRGHYQYQNHPDYGSSFTIFFLEKSGRVEGSVIDDIPARRATLAGTFIFPAVQFTKVYTNQTSIQHVERQGDQIRVATLSYNSPIQYEGLMDEDGKSMSGTWTITQPIFCTGTWTAHRESEEEAVKVKEKVKRPKEVVIDEPLR